MEFLTLSTWWILFVLGTITLTVYQIGRNLQINLFLYLGGFPLLAIWVLAFVLTGWVGGIIVFFGTIPGAVILYLSFLGIFRRS